MNKCHRKSVSVRTAQFLMSHLVDFDNERGNAVKTNGRTNLKKITAEMSVKIDYLSINSFKFKKI